MSGDRLSLLYVRNPAEQPALIVPLRWTTVKARYENRGMVVFVVDVARGESKTSCLLHSVDVLRPNFVVVGIGFELRLRNAADADHHYRVIEGFGCKHAFHTIIAPLKTKEFYAAREKDHQFPILGQGHSQSLAKMVY